MERLTKVMDKYLSDAKKKVLTLIVSKQWFDMIVSGEKNEEYRVIKGFWMSRLLLIKDEEFKDFDKYDKLHIGKTFEMLIDTNTIKEKLNNGTMKFVPFTHVLFKNGYYDDSPKVVKEIESITSASRKKVFAQASGWIMNFSSSSSSNMDKTTELSYNHLISQLRKENADLRNEVRELRKLLTRKGDKPPN